MYLKEKLQKVGGELDARSLSILSPLFEIPPEHIDFDRVTIEKQNFMIKIDIHGRENKFCPLVFMIGIGSEIHKIFFDFLEVANILYYDDFSSEAGYDDIYWVIDNVLKNKVEKKEYYINNELHRILLTSPVLKISDKKLISFTKKVKTILPWQKPEIRSYEYEPWIS